MSRLYAAGGTARLFVFFVALAFPKHQNHGTRQIEPKLQVGDIRLEQVRGVRHGGYVIIRRATPGLTPKPSVKWPINHGGYYDRTRMEPCPISCSHRSPNALHHSAVRLSDAGKRDGLAFNSGFPTSYASCMFELRNHLYMCYVAKHAGASKLDSFLYPQQHVTPARQSLFASL